MPVAGHERAEDAFADAAVGDAERLGRPDVHDRLEDRAAGDDQIGALVADAGEGGALVMVHAGQGGGDSAHVRRRHLEAVDRAPVVARQAPDRRWRAWSPCRWCPSAGCRPCRPEAER